MRRDERAWKREKAIGVRRGTVERVVARRFRREERVGVRHDVRDPVAELLVGRPLRVGALVFEPVRRRAVLRNPFEAPLERPDDSIGGDRGELSLPGVEEGLKHSPSMLYSAFSDRPMMFMSDTRKCTRKRATRAGGVVFGG